MKLYILHVPDGRIMGNFPHDGRNIRANSAAFADLFRAGWFLRIYRETKP